MKRRDFIKRTAPATLLPMILGGYRINAYSQSPVLQMLAQSAANTDHVLVIIQLNGGNDGLNTVIPLDQYSVYSTVRANIAIAENKVLQLKPETGLHPSMTGLSNIYTEGKLAVVQSVGYPTPNFSHFRATDIWLTGSDYNQYLLTGWMGRYLNEEFPNYPTGYPNAQMPDPLAIQIGSVVSTGLQGETVSMGIAITSPTAFYNLVTGTTEPAPNTPYGHELTYIRLIAEQTNQYSTAIKTAASKATNKATYPTQNSLADQLKIVAQLVAGGLKTRIYVVNLGGFDTHSSQVSGSDTSLGNHATLLGRVSGAIAAFQTDLQLLGVEKRVVGMTFSEFGRRIVSNASLGTDHGAAAPLFVFGSNVNGKVYGSNVAIPTNANVNSNIPMQFDFRNIYGSILKDWFNVPQTELDAMLLTPKFTSFDYLPIIKPDSTVSVREEIPEHITLHQNYPNPFGAATPAGNSTTRIKFTTDGRHIQLKVFDNIGREVSTLVDGVFPVGEHEVSFIANGLPSGTYYYHLRNGTSSLVKTMILQK